MSRRKSSINSSRSGIRRDHRLKIEEFAALSATFLQSPWRLLHVGENGNV